MPAPRFHSHCRCLIGLACLMTLTGCSLFSRLGSRQPHVSPVEQAAYEADAARCTVYVMSNGFHSGLVLRRDQIPEEIWPEIVDFPDHPWIEVGWGSEIFYRAKSITPTVVVGALLPNASVLHVVGWDEPPQEVFGGDLVRLKIEPARFAEMCRLIHESYVLDSAGQPEDLGPGIYGDGRFYRARGKYYFPKTCNVWTARVLAAGGVLIHPELCSTADVVLMYARRAGLTVQRR